MAAEKNRIAVIIPIWNQERFLAEALDSLLAQSCRDWLAFCVNDGSSDKTPAILAEYARKDSRFIVISQINGGVSRARNAGLKAAIRDERVRWVTFLDPDDRFEGECFAEAVRAAKANPGSVIEWGFDTGGLERMPQSRGPGPNLWNKMFPVEYLQEIRFCPEANFAEDLAFILEVFHKFRPHRIVLPEVLHHYRISDNSLAHKPVDAIGCHRRFVLIEHLIDVFARDRKTLKRVCREEIAVILRQTARGIKAAAPERQPVAVARFYEGVRQLAARGLPVGYHRLIALNRWTRLRLSLTAFFANIFVKKD